MGKWVMEIIMINGKWIKMKKKDKMDN